MIPQAHLLSLDNYPSREFFQEQAKVASAIIETASSEDNYVIVTVSRHYTHEFLIQLSADGYEVEWDYDDNSPYTILRIRW